MRRQRKVAPTRPSDLSEELYERLMNEIIAYKEAKAGRSLLDSVRAILQKHFHLDRSFSPGVYSRYAAWKTYLLSRLGSRGGHATAARRRGVELTTNRPWSY